MTSPFLLLWLYLLILVLTLVWRGREITSPWLFLLRSFFPNWRFYHRPGNQPRLFTRCRLDNGRWTPWQMFMPRARIHALDLFHNPKNNLQHATQNLIDHLSADIHALPPSRDARTLVTYRLTERLAYQRATSINAGAAITGYQFEIRALSPMAAPPEETTLLTSPLIAVPQNDD